jgi:hypothetical protein
MGQVPIGAKLRRRIERETGMQVIHASGNGSNVFQFTTPEHHHGVWSKRTGEWRMLAECPRFTSCMDLFEKEAS